MLSPSNVYNKTYPLIHGKKPMDYLQSLENQAFTSIMLKMPCIVLWVGEASTVSHSSVLNVLYIQPAIQDEPTVQK